MVYCPESDSVLFVGSPFIDGLEGLTGSGLFISDIPLHDATRDVILVGEQARAQVSECTYLYFYYVTNPSYITCPKRKRNRSKLIIITIYKKSGTFQSLLRSKKLPLLSFFCCCNHFRTL